MRTDRCEDCYQEYGTYVPSVVVLHDGYCGPHAIRDIGAVPNLLLADVEYEAAYRHRNFAMLREVGSL